MLLLTCCEFLIYLKIVVLELFRITTGRHSSLYTAREPPTGLKDQHLTPRSDEPAMQFRACLAILYMKLSSKCWFDLVVDANQRCVGVLFAAPRCPFGKSLGATLSHLDPGSFLQHRCTRCSSRTCSYGHESLAYLHLPFNSLPILRKENRLSWPRSASAHTALGDEVHTRLC